MVELVAVAVHFFFDVPRRNVFFLYTAEKHVQFVYFGRIAFGLVVGEFGSAGSVFYGIIQGAYFIYQAYFFSFFARPHTPFAYGIDFLCGFLSVFGNEIDKALVGLLYALLHNVYSPCRYACHGRHHAGIGIGGYDFRVDAVFICQRFEVRENAEYTDRPCDGVVLGKNLLACHSDVVSAGGSIVAKGDNQRFFLAELLEFEEDFIRSVGTSARGVDAEHYGFDVVILG